MGEVLLKTDRVAFRACIDTTSTLHSDKFGGRIAGEGQRGQRDITRRAYKTCSTFKGSAQCFHLKLEQSLVENETVCQLGQDYLESHSA